MAIATIIGTWLDTSRELYSAGYVICRIAILWASLSSGLYVSSFLVTEIMAHEVGSREHARNFSLMSYSFATVYLVIIIVALFPFFSEFLVLGFYTCYIYWTGIPYMIRTDGQKQMTYALLSFIIMASIHLLMFFLFGKIFSAIFL